MVVMLCIAHRLSMDGNSQQGKGLCGQKSGWAEETASPCWSATPFYCVTAVRVRKFLVLHG